MLMSPSGNEGQSEGWRAGKEQRGDGKGANSGGNVSSFLIQAALQLSHVKLNQQHSVTEYPLRHCG